jgi:hypothetical protein
MNTNRLRIRYWHPYLIALYPIIALRGANSSAVVLKEILLPTLAVLLLAAIIVFVFNKTLISKERAALASSFLIALLFSYELIYRGMGFMYRRPFSDTSAIRHEYALVLWTIVTIVGLLLIIKIPLSLVSANKFLNLMSVILLAVAGSMSAKDFVSLGSAQLARGSPLPAVIKLQKTEVLRDIYFLVFDRYAGSQTLLTQYGIDNSKFLNDLELRGFSISPNSHANYPRTVYSMASALNCDYLPEECRRDSHYSEMIQEHLVGRSLIAIGYQYLHFGNWYQPLRSNKHASYVLPTSVFPSEFAESLYATTPLSKIFPFHDKYTFVLNKFHEVARVAEKKNLTFVYAHFLMPHTPYVFDSDGSRKDWRKSRYGDQKINYIHQLEATNTLILETVDSILSKSEVEPIIVLVADEGPYLTSEQKQLDRKEKIQVRTRILCASYLPNSSDIKPHAQTLTPVNVFRLILSKYFNADLELLPNRTYYWQEADNKGRPAKSNDRFVDVSELLAE